MEEPFLLCFQDVHQFGGNSINLFMYIHFEAVQILMKSN